MVGGVRGALHSGLLEALWRWQPCTTEEIATRAHLPERSVELTLAALAVGDVVVHEGADGWRLTAPPEAWGLLVGFEDDICRYVETGAVTRADDDGRYTGVLPVIGRFHQRVAEVVAPLLARPHARVLELGAGTAPWSRALLAIDSSITAVAVDLPPVIAQLERSLADTPWADRIELRSHDVRALALTGRFDLIVVSGLCRLLDEAENAQLFERCADLVSDDGRLVICDAFAGSADPDGTLALYALGLAARSRAETLWSARDYRRWLSAAGLTTAELVLTEGVGISVLVASTAPPATLPDPFSPAHDDHSRTDTKDQA
jgi:SAM-dependent methyltransferase